MDVAAIKVEKIIAELNKQKDKQGLSYQAIADACEVSQTTIIRIFKGEAEPTITMLQSIAAAVQYKPQEDMLLPPADCSQSQYTEYLIATMRQQASDNARHIAELRTHYNMLHSQDRRTILWLSVSIVVLVVFLVSWLIFDILHPEIGWITR